MATPPTDRSGRLLITRYINDHNELEHESTHTISAGRETEQENRSLISLPNSTRSASYEDTIEVNYSESQWIMHLLDCPTSPYKHSRTFPFVISVLNLQSLNVYCPTRHHLVFPLSGQQLRLDSIRSLDDDPICQVSIDIFIQLFHISDNHHIS